MTVPSDDHLIAFGRVMHNYAAVESGIKIAMSGILEIDLAHALIAFEPYSAINVKNVAKSLAKEKLKPKLAETFCHIVGEWSAHNTLRNTIAHTRWTNGIRPGSIKPRNLSIKEGRAKFVGDGEDEADYTADDLEAAATKLHEINERLKMFLELSGLNRIIESKMADDNDDKS